MAEAFVPLSFAPGEAHQFDWSHEVVLIMPHNCQCQSSACPVTSQPDAVGGGADPGETQEMLFDAHNSD
jgi:hypothetical protein